MKAVPREQIAVDTFIHCCACVFAFDGGISNGVLLFSVHLFLFLTSNTACVETPRFVAKLKQSDKKALIAFLLLI